MTDRARGLNKIIAKTRDDIGKVAYEVLSSIPPPPPPPTHTHRHTPPSPLYTFCCCCSSSSSSSSSAVTFARLLYPSLLIVILSVCLLPLPNLCLCLSLSLCLCLSLSLSLCLSLHKSFLLFAGSTMTSALRMEWQSWAVKFCPSTPGKQAVINPDQL